jgi:hypothetical protein
MAQVPDGAWQRSTTVARPPLADGPIAETHILQGMAGLNYRSALQELSRDRTAF